MNQTDLRAANRHRHRRRGTKGAELLEFTFNFLPFLAMIIVIVDTAWAVFAEATLQQAVRMAVRQGVTLTASQVDSNLTDTVKGLVRFHSVGLLNGSNGLGYVKVNYFDQDNPSLDVSNQAFGNRAGNIMQVSVQNFPVSPWMARIFNLGDRPDNNPTTINVYAADIIEPLNSTSKPPIGPAP